MPGLNLPRLHRRPPPQIYAFWTMTLSPTLKDEQGSRRQRAFVTAAATSTTPTLPLSAERYVPAPRKYATYTV